MLPKFNVPEDAPILRVVALWAKVRDEDEVKEDSEFAVTVVPLVVMFPEFARVKLVALIRFVKVPVKLRPVVTVPAPWVKLRRFVTIPAPVFWIKVLFVIVPLGLLVVNVAGVYALEVAETVSFVLEGKRLPVALVQ